MSNAYANWLPLFGFKLLHTAVLVSKASYYSFVVQHDPMLLSVAPFRIGDCESKQHLVTGRKGGLHVFAPLMCAAGVLWLLVIVNSTTSGVGGANSHH